MREQKPVRRGINLKLVLILSVLLSLFVREVFGAKVNSIAVPLDFVGQYRAIVSVRSDGSLDLITQKRDDVTHGASLDSTWIHLNEDSSNIDRRIKENLRLEGNTLRYFSQKVVEFRLDPSRGLIAQSMSNPPLGFGSDRILDIDSFGHFYARLSFQERAVDKLEPSKDNTGSRRSQLAMFGQSLERFLSFPEIWSIGFQTGNATIGTAEGPSVALSRTRIEDLLRIRNLSMNWPMPGVKLPTDLALTSVTQNPAVLENLVKRLFEKLQHLRVGYIELTTPHALRPEWLRAFTKAAAPLEVQTGIRIRLIARVDTKSPTELQMQLNELAKTAKGQPYLAGFYLPSSDEMALERIRNFRRTVRPNLTLEGPFVEPMFMGLNKQEASLRMVERIQYRELGFLTAVENMERNSVRSQLEEWASRTLFRVTTLESHCESLMTLEAM